MLKYTTQHHFNSHTAWIPHFTGLSTQLLNTWRIISVAWFMAWISFFFPFFPAQSRAQLLSPPAPPVSPTLPDSSGLVLSCSCLVLPGRELRFHPAGHHICTQFCVPEPNLSWDPSLVTNLTQQPIKVGAAERQSHFMTSLSTNAPWHERLWGCACRGFLLL